MVYPRPNLLLKSIVTGSLDKKHSTARRKLKRDDHSRPPSMIRLQTEAAIGYRPSVLRFMLPKSNLRSYDGVSCGGIYDPSSDGRSRRVVPNETALSEKTGQNKQTQQGHSRYASAHSPEQFN